jgi:4-hydroxy-3-methylbut-2-enyl diphosphate reductase
VYALHNKVKRPTRAEELRMDVLRAEAMGMCFGVRDALAVLAALPAPHEVTVHGELVHNAEVLADLDRRGFHRSPEGERPVPATSTVLITAHGVSDRERARLRDAGKRLVDTTCPLVHKAHAAAQRLQAEGRRVVVIGRGDHVEVRGLVEDLVAPIVVGELADVRTWAAPRLGVVCQTTTPVERAQAIVAAIVAANPASDVRTADTICQPTKDRVDALQRLLQQVDGLVVVGGANSNNTRQLVLAAVAAGLPAWRVQHAGELRPEWFVGHRRIGLSAGTSTLARTIDDVHAALAAIGAA